MKPDIEQEVLERIDQKRGSIIEFLRDLISFPSVTGEELQIQRFIAQKLATMGLQVDMWEPDQETLKKHPAYLPPERGYQDRPNVVGIYKGAGNGRSLLFNGHVDVIPPGPLEAWEHPAWGGEMKDHRLYGRGASDMKSGLAAMTMALESLIHLEVKLRGDVILEYTVDEEATGNGTLACVLKGYRADAGICCETSSLHVQPACIGRIWFEILIHGKPSLLLYRGESCRECAVREPCLPQAGMYYGRDTDSESRWPGATFGGDEAEAEERGGGTDLQEAWIHGGAGFRTDEMGWQEAIDGLACL